jgi:hypothetical protein
MKYTEERVKIVSWIEDELTGKNVDEFKIYPLEEIHIGFLYPQVDLKKKEANPTVNKSSPPSSIGFSFFVMGDNVRLSINIKACKYDYLQDKSWNKKKLTDDDGEQIDIILPSNICSVAENSQEVLYSNGLLTSLWRKHNQGYLVTLSLSNQNKVDSNLRVARSINENALFNVSFSAEISEGELLPYPSKDPSLLTDEEKELEFRYRNVNVYGIGHAVALDWFKAENGNMILSTVFMPKVEVPSVTANTANDRSNQLNFKYLSTIHKSKEVLDSLEDFVLDYENWIIKESEDLTELSEHDKATVKKLADKMFEAKERMSEGVSFLRENKLARIAFAYTNAAMLKQMNPNVEGNNIESEKFNWRPFQLAFILMSLESVVNEESEYRDTVDLIWFPTGGGKTEAYLGVMAFLFVFRRLKYPDSSAGTVAIMRYTLRLLTSQQFLRAAKVVSALELLRRCNKKLLGTEPFSLGLWVGAGSTPNTITKAHENIKDGDFTRLGLTFCPWCNEPFKPENYVFGNESFHFECKHSDCEFGRSDQRKLPCNTIDEELYKNPPTLLLATVDKFARLAWEERAESFFGSKPNRPPELIIQDELHLISSELGSIVGLYEVGIEAALALRHIYPKYIASTATIKNAETQVKLLYGRKMSMFPPSGYSHDDSYFAKAVPTNLKDGRLYVGYLAYNRSKSKSIEPLAGLTLAAPQIFYHDREEYMDAWWTQMVYHGSLKGVGSSQSAYNSDVLSYMNKQYHKKEEQDKNDGKDLIKLERNLTIDSLTSNQGPEKNNQIFKNLELEHAASDAIDVALATNMVSVGLDVDRLSLMIINGQPLTTAEYIQASSRVGRGNVPGIVFVNFYKSQTRSLSHYENFKPYHESFYRFVEPTSLTPFTEQALKRALHAAFIIALRMGDIGLTKNRDADSFSSSNPSVKRAIKIVQARLRSAIQGPFNSEFEADKEKALYKKAKESLEQCIDEWDYKVEELKKNRTQLVYNASDNAAYSLIKSFEKVNAAALWPTLTSMRSVEQSGLVKVEKY